MSKIHEKFLVEMLQTAMRYELEITPIFKAYDLTPVQYNIMRILKGAYPESLHPGEVKSRMLFSNSDITRLMDRLVSKGYVFRQTCEANRRKVDMIITEEGKEVLDKIFEELSECTGDFYSGVLEEEEMRVAKGVFEKLRTKFKNN